MAINQELVDEITARDKEAFERAVNDPGYQTGLKLPNSAYRYLLIPQRLLEIVRRPSEAALKIYTGSNIGVRGEVSWGPTRLIGSHLLSYTGNPESSVIFVADYSDEEYIRGKGVAPSFYQRLHECASKMGYRFTYGLNLPENMGFFTEKLGRTLLRDTRPEIWQYLRSSPTDFFGWGDRLDRMTIDFLRPEDREEFTYTGDENAHDRWRSYFMRMDNSPHA
jgi:hypothetical protein